MFCPNCGTNLPDGLQFCENCGASLAATPQGNFGMPTTSVAQINGPEPGLSKGKFLSSKKLDQGTKLLARIAWGLVAVCLVILALAVNTTFNGKAHKLPWFSMVMGKNADDEMDKLLEEAEDILDDLEVQLKNASGSEKEEIEEKLELAEKMIDNFSMSNIRDFYENAMKEKEMAEAFDVFLTVAVVLCVIAAAFLLLGALLRSTALVVIALFPALILTGFFSGMIYLLLAIVAFIALAVIHGKLNAAYKAYKKGTYNAPVAY